MRIPPASEAYLAHLAKRHEENERIYQAKKEARKLERERRIACGQPAYRYPFGWQAHAVATLMIIVIVLIGAIACRLTT